MQLPVLLGQIYLGMYPGYRHSSLWDDRCCTSQKGEAAQVFW